MKVSQSVLRTHSMIICIFTMTYKIFQSGQPNSMQNSQFYVSLPVESYCTSSYIFFPIWYNSRYSRTASAKNQEPILRSTNPTKNPSTQKYAERADLVCGIRPPRSR
uniref:(northern house mosquito) hypothetical protein n=1 Tax=Culex pipiens TaxID=7175 RepID=A0A8D8BZJ1_CULPI